MMKSLWYHESVYKRLTYFSIIVFSLMLGGSYLLLLPTSNLGLINEKVSVEPNSQVLGESSNTADPLFFDCSQDLYNCEDLNFAEAQAILAYCGLSSDVHGLDSNHDSVACYP